MATRIVSVERHVKQVRHGSRYKGYVKILDTELAYELVFGVPIARLENMEPLKNETEVRNLFHITVKRQDENIELTNEEYRFFFWLIVAFAIDYYNSPLTRDKQEYFVDDMLRPRGPLLELSVGMTIRGSYFFPPELCKMLSAPKFGCKLIT